jgi:hypothetical protein
MIGSAQPSIDTPAEGLKARLANRKQYERSHALKADTYVRLMAPLGDAGE